MIPDINALWVVFFLLLSTVLLNTLVFGPILRVIDRRAVSVRSARELAESASHKATAAADEYKRTLNAAHAEVYKQMEETRRAALEKRSALVAETKGLVEKELTSAAERVRQESAAARGTLDRQASELAAAIMSRVLGRAS